ncbi:primosomal replication protein PriC [Testudinibacter sp. P80/BLE/0925]|uniref:primosomal replication protein PriC n=1 Tax=Testudinibacter sp. TW-1 TaxID=3417757 RepID=UPI003D36B97E
MSAANVQLLMEKIESYFRQLLPYQQQPISAKLDSRLFATENETVGDCLTQIQQTFSILRQATEAEQVEFYTEKLLAQYHALLDMLQPTASVQPHFAANFTPKAATKKNKHQVHDLPPQVRLEKYYQFLRQLNDLIAQQNDAMLQAEPLQQAAWLQRIQQTEQRKQRCQDAIDNLEEYLLFVAERDNL